MYTYAANAPCEEADNDSNIAKKRHIYEELRHKNESPFLSKIRDIEKAMGFVTPLKWRHLIVLTLSHLLTLAWFCYHLLYGTFFKWQTILFGLVYNFIGGFGVTGGVHRYWTHRSFKAEPPLQWILAICFSIAGQNTIFEWVRDHRVHHKFSETSADPHDVTRGFFFSHVGWLMMIKHPDVIREGCKMDMSDITNDPVVQFHTKYFNLLKLVFCFAVPISIPPLMWGENWGPAVLYQFLAIHASLNGVWSVNSFAHICGNRPYNPIIKSAENWCVSLVALGEGWHNYHHTFPWDYKAAELPYFVNLTTILLDGFAAIGWAHHLKQASPQLIQATLKNQKYYAYDSVKDEYTTNLKNRQIE